MKFIKCALYAVGILSLIAFLSCGNEEQENTTHITTNDSRFETTEAEELNSAGTALAREGRYEEAMEEFLEALSIEPGNATILGNIGNCFMMTNDLPEATSYLRASLRADSLYLNSAVNLGNVLYMDGQDSAAYWNQYVLDRTTDPKLTGVVHLRMAYICTDNHDCEGARTHYESALNDMRVAGVDVSSAQKFEATLAACQ